MWEYICVFMFIEKHVYMLDIVYFHEINVSVNLLYYAFVKNAVPTKNANLHEA